MTCPHPDVCSRVQNIFLRKVRKKTEQEPRVQRERWVGFSGTGEAGVGGFSGRYRGWGERERETEDRWFKLEKKQSDEAKGGVGGGESS